MLQLKAADPEGFRKACGKFVTGVTIATVKAADGSPHGMTANSFTSVSLEPPLVLVCVNLRLQILEHFLKSRQFGINILSEQQQELSNRFARSGIDRFAGVEWYEGLAGVPLFPGSLAALECRLEQHVQAGDHLILLGEVLHLAFRNGAPLGYFGGGYRRLSPPDTHKPPRRAGADSSIDLL